MSMYKVVLLVREMSAGRLTRLYVREDLQLPFVPTLGMQFKQGISTWLWETGDSELMPQVETVTYDLDEEMFVCLLTVDRPLNSSFWTRIDEADFEKSIYPSYIEPRS
jgi:hypothetical protein